MEVPSPVGSFYIFPLSDFFFNHSEEEVVIAWKAGRSSSWGEQSGIIAGTVMLLLRENLWEAKRQNKLEVVS